MKKKKKKSSHSPIFYIILCTVLVLLFALLIFLKIKKQQISAIPEGTIGNTTGNLRGKGLFCEYNGKIYFSNPYDSGALYVMNPDGSEMKRLIKSNVSYINAGGNYLFYYLANAAGGTGLGYIRSTKGIYRSSLKGKDTFRLDSDMATSMVLIDNQLYIQHYDNKNLTSLHKIPVAGAEEEFELSEDILEPACVQNGVIYYSGLINDHFLYAWNTTTDTSSVIWEGNTSYPTVIGYDVYFMNVDENYRLFRYNISSRELTALTDERVDCYNIYNNMLFYQINSSASPALMRLNLNSGDRELIAEGNYTNINTTSAYTYFQPFGQNNIIYRTSTFGSVSVDDFPAAKEAAASDGK